MAIALSPDNLTDYITNLEEVFRCYICLGRLQDTRLCPKCSKMCCFQCIRRWLIEQKPSCPHCRCSLLLHELVKCRWVDDLLGQLKSSQARKNALTKDQCAAHSEQLSVYCVTCGVCVCHQCALWAGEHSNHDFQPVSDIYERHKKGLYEEVNNLKKRLAETHDCSADIDRYLSAYNQDRDSHMKQINKVMKDISSRIDVQISSQITKLRNQQAVLNKESDMVEQKIGEVIHKIDTYVKSELIRSSPQILQELLGMSTQLAKPPAAVVSSLDKELVITNQLIPSYTDGEFVIEAFSPHRRRGSPIYSPPLTLHGQVWKLKVYPDGNGIFRGEFLSVFLELHSGFPGSAKYEYRVSMLHVSGNSERTIYREFSSEFEPGECWGYNRFYRLEHLVTKGYVDSVEDNLKLQFSVRSPTFYHDSLQQQKQVVHLKEQLESLEERVRRVDYTQQDSSGEVLSESQAVIQEEEMTGVKQEESDTRTSEGDLTSEQLDRALLFTPSEDSSEMSEIVLAPASDDDDEQISLQEESDQFLSSALLVPDSQESVEMPDLNSINIQDEVGEVSEGERDTREENLDLDITLVSDAPSDRAAASLSVTHTPYTTVIPVETSQDQADSSFDSEGNNLSIHSLDSPLPEATYWNPLSHSQSRVENTPTDQPEERVIELEDILTEVDSNENRLGPLQDQFLEATRFTDSLPNNFPNIQASILACLRDVSNNPLLGFTPSPPVDLPHTFRPRPGTHAPVDLTPNPLDILPLNNSNSETEEDTQSYNLIWIDDREGYDPPSGCHPPE